MDIEKAKNSQQLGRYFVFIKPQDKKEFIKLAEDSKSIDEMVKKPKFEILTRDIRKIKNMSINEVIEFGKINEK